jgi:adenylosuccinate lyase
VLLALTQAGISREDAYRLVQQNAMKVWAGKGDFLELLKADPEIAGKIAADKLAACFDASYHTKHVDTIFARVFGKNAAAKAVA